tara:strand:+ start:358 stop:741 length:384 start_codon:yes stop_codon:yes gene_type:complete
MKIVSKESIRVTTLAGTAVLFEAGVERDISEEIGLLAIQMGAEEVGGGEGTESEAAEEVAEEDSEESDKPDSQDAELDAVLVKLMDEGNPENFNVDGTPKAAVVNKLLGRTIDGDTRKAAWESILNS